MKYVVNCDERNEFLCNSDSCHVSELAPWLRRLFIGLLLQGCGFDPRSVCVSSVVDKVTLEQDFMRVFQVSFVSIIPPVFHTHLQLYAILIRRTSGRRPRTLKKRFRIWGSMGQRSTATSFSGLQRNRITTSRNSCVFLLRMSRFSWTHVVLADVWGHHRGVIWPAALRVGVAERGWKQFREGVMREARVWLAPSVPKREVKMSPALLRASQPPLETLTIFRGACALLSVTSHPPLYVHLNCVFMCRYLTQIVVTMNKHVWVIDSKTSARNNTEKQIYSDQILRTKTVGLFETSIPDYKLS